MSEFEIDFGDSAEWLLMLHAWIDESGHEQKDDFMFLAGFLGSKDQWRRFADRWVEMGGTPSFKTRHVVRDRERAESKLARLGSVPTSCGLRPMVAGVRMADYWDLVAGTDQERKSKGWLVCLYPLVIETLLSVPKDELVEFGFDSQDTYEIDAGHVFRAIEDCPDERLRHSDGLTKVASWRFVPHGRTTLTQPADYLAYAWRSHMRDPNSEESRLTKPILDSAGLT